MGGKKKICVEDGCSNAVLARSLCRRHYYMRKRHGIDLPAPSNKPRGVPCCVDGCSIPAMQRGYCEKHLNRLDKYGDPLAGPTFIGEPLAWIEARLDYQGDDCQLWPYARGRDGHGNFTGNGRPESLAQYICERVHGQRPTNEHQAAHSCGNGHLACGNPRHLRWATPKENAEDRDAHGRTAHGEKNAMAKLTWPEVREIRRLQHVETQRRLAEMFGVSVNTIQKIHYGESWRHDPLLTSGAAPSSASKSWPPCSGR